MAMTAPPVHDRKRVKVYELKSNDWFDRGTGFCTGTLVNDEARIHVQSEDEPERTLLETKITKDDGYQKQQDTLIVWTEQNVTDMALSFQEADGCSAIWDFVNDAQQRLALNGVEDGLSDEMMEPSQPLILPETPNIGNLPDVEAVMRQANQTNQGREALAKYVMANDYILKLIPLVQMAEEFESREDLHRLCNIMKTIILLNDNTIIEQVVKDDVILGVVGALEYDPDFPYHKANHRLYLQGDSRYKEVVKIEDPLVKQKIHYTYRLQYLKDVVLARILDDPTYSVLNSLIFFNQVEIVQHVQANPLFLKELFGIFTNPEDDAKRKKDAVIFIQQCSAIAKGFQPNGRQALYSNLVANGLLHVITYALNHPDALVRVAGTDILVALIEHDPLMMRSQIFKAVQDKGKTLTDTLIELLLVETDMGVKTQMGDAIRVLLDPIANTQSVEMLARNGADFFVKMRHQVLVGQHADNYVQAFYDDSTKKLFKPLADLENRSSMQNLDGQEQQLYSHLVDMLCFFVRSHTYRSKAFLLSLKLHARVGQLLQCPQKHLKLSALKFFRSCLQLHDPFHHRQIIQYEILNPILQIIYDTMPRDNLLNSACLEFFEFIKRENLKELTVHLVQTYRDRLEKITYVDTFRQLIEKFETLTAPVPDNLSFTTVETEQANRSGLMQHNGQRWHGLRESDPEEDAYFNAASDEDDDSFASQEAAQVPKTNGVGPPKRLVDYPEDDEDELGMEITSSNAEDSPATAQPSDTSSPPPRSSRDQTPPPPERLSEKRRREEDEEEDELGKLSTAPKRRSSLGSTTSSVTVASSNGIASSRRKRGVSAAKESGSAPKKISISLAVKSENEAPETGDTGNEDELS